MLYVFCFLLFASYLIFCFMLPEIKVNELWKKQETCSKKCILSIKRLQEKKK